MYMYNYVCVTIDNITIVHVHLTLLSLHTVL